MKNIFLYVSLILLFISCGSSDDSGNAVNYNYFPIQLQNNWAFTATGTGAVNSTSSISGTSLVDGNTFYQVTNSQNIFGFNNNPTYVRKDGNNYYISGSATLGTQTIQIHNQKFLNENASLGETVNDFVHSETSTPTSFSQGGMSGTYTITTNFRTVIKVIGKGAATVNSQSYTNTIKQQWNVYISSKINITSGVASTVHTLIEETQLATLTQHFAENVGDVHTQIVLDGSQISFNNNVSLLGQTMDISPYTASIQAQINAMQENRTYTMSSYQLY